MSEMKRDCGDCGAKPGELHDPGCDVERCAACGRQAISCKCKPETYRKYARLPWTGEWPGDAECRALGWYVRNVPGRSDQRCGPNDEGARPDYTRLIFEARWNPDVGGYEVRDGSGAWRAVVVGKTETEG